ncbi:MAG: class I SAM-dependent methyltransferase [Deltaproteobacteria bacterium]|nr:class I SAM-dependent methyltransferase [Deltaproteobacteria bacterium]
MLARVLEPEVMDTPDEARDYDAMDHSEVNRRFCDDLLAFAGKTPLDARRPARILDLGTGTALIPIELCTRAKGFSVLAIDLAQHMLDLARVNVSRAGLDDRITLEKVDAKGTRFDDGEFGATISNSIVHHIPDPGAVLPEMWRVTARGGLLFVRDLHRPTSEAEVDRLVLLYGGEAPSDPSRMASFEHQRALFRASLCAALTVNEVAEMVRPLGIPASAVSMTSDRHWTLAFEKP